MVEGLREVFEKDIVKHQGLLEQSILDMQAFERGRNHAVKQKQHYRSLIGGGKYNDEALERAIVGININIQHLENKIASAKEKRDFEKNIVDTLTNQLREYNKNIELLAMKRK